jgi:hypothetical protein
MLSSSLKHEQEPSTSNSKNKAHKHKRMKVVDALGQTY